MGRTRVSHHKWQRYLSIDAEESPEESAFRGESPHSIDGGSDYVQSASGHPGSSSPVGEPVEHVKYVYKNTSGDTVNALRLFPLSQASNEQHREVFDDPKQIFVDTEQLREQLDAISASSPRFLFRLWDPISGKDPRLSLTNLYPLQLKPIPYDDLTLNGTDGFTPLAYHFGLGAMKSQDLPLEVLFRLFRSHVLGAVSQEPIFTMSSSWTHSLDIAINSLSKPEDRARMQITMLDTCQLFAHLRTPFIGNVKYRRRERAGVQNMVFHCSALNAIDARVGNYPEEFLVFGPIPANAITTISYAQAVELQDFAMDTAQISISRFINAKSAKHFVSMMMKRLSEFGASNHLLLPMLSYFMAFILTDDYDPMPLVRAIASSIDDPGRYMDGVELCPQELIAFAEYPIRPLEKIRNSAREDLAVEFLQALTYEFRIAGDDGA